MAGESSHQTLVNRVALKTFGKTRGQDEDQQWLLLSCSPTDGSERSAANTRNRFTQIGAVSLQVFISVMSGTNMFLLQEIITTEIYTSGHVFLPCNTELPRAALASRLVFNAEDVVMLF